MSGSNNDIMFAIIYHSNLFRKETLSTAYNAYDVQEIAKRKYELHYQHHYQAIEN